MNPKIKNSLIFIGVATAFILIYVFFIKGSSVETPNLVSSSGPLVQTTGAFMQKNSSITEEFLASLLNVTNIKLNNAILSDDAFVSLRDSSIVLIPDGTEGRPNPFAPFGSDNFTLGVSPVVNPPATTPLTTTPPPETKPATIPPPVTIPPAKASTTSIKSATTTPPLTTPVTPKTP